MKFKIGDKVKIREDLVVDLLYGCDVFMSEMSDYRGKEANITAIHHNYLKDDVYSLDIDNGEWYWTDEMLEKTEKLEKRLEMKKSDLQNGMIVECENGARYMVVKNFNEYTPILSDETRDVLMGIDKDNNYMPLSKYNQDLRLNRKDIFGYNIAKVGYPKHIGCPISDDLKWIWERTTLTENEKAILKSVNKQYEWIVRQRDGNLALYKDKPIKIENFGNWVNEKGYYFFIPFNHLFQFIKWENENPYNIDDLLK